jgi:hypothetical protein
VGELGVACVLGVLCVLCMWRVRHWLVLLLQLLLLPLLWHYNGD